MVGNNLKGAFVLKSVSVSVAEDVYKKFSAICHMMGRKEQDVVNSMFEKYVSIYCDIDGNFTPREAVLLCDQSNSLWVDNKSKPNVLGSCQVLSEVTVIGAPYYTVFFEGRLMKVPVSQVRLLEK